jgi:putative photosynthetic complex assembly protein
MNAQAIRSQSIAPWGVAGMLLVVVLLVAAGGRRELANSTPSLADPRASVQLWFVDRADGGVDVLAANGGRKIAEFAPASNGFARGVLRSMARERRRSGIDRAPPFVLLERADGGLSLHDPQTGRQVSLDAFGPDNRRVFAVLLLAAIDPNHSPLT